MTPFISIVIPVYNQGPIFEKCLESVRNLQYDNFEVIVVDDHSDNHCAEEARQLGFQVIRLAKRSGAGKARDVGAAHATGDIVAFLDSDCLALPEYLQDIADALSRDIAGVGGRYLPTDPKGAMSRFFTYLLDYYFFEKMSGRTDFLPGGACAFWRDVLMEPRPKRELFYFANMASGEDMMMCLEISQKNTLVFAPHIAVRHEAPGLLRFAKQQSNWGYSRTLTSFLFFHKKFLAAQDTRMPEQAAQVLSVGALLPGLLAGLLLGRWFFLYCVVSVYLVSAAPFFLYTFRREKKLTAFVTLAFFLLLARNAFLFFGLLRGLFAIAFKFRFKKFRPPAGNS